MPVEVVPNLANIKALERSTEVVGLISDMVDAVGNAARGSGIRVEDIPGDIPLPIETHVEIHNDAARGAVVIAHPSGLAVEAKHRVLGGALDAART